jgi:hypothetical protein
VEDGDNSTARKNAAPKRFVALYSRSPLEFRALPKWESWYQAEIRCSRCIRPGLAWEAAPRAVDAHLCKPPAAAIVSEGLQLIREDLMELLRPYWRGAYFGRCHLVRGAEVRPLPYYTALTPARLCINAYRARHCGQHQCPVCGAIYNFVLDPAGAIVRSTLDDRLVYQDIWAGEIFVERELARRLQLRERVPGLRWLDTFPVIEKALDGDVLPGDEGWTGVFTPRSPPRTAEMQVERAKITQELAPLEFE